MDIEVEHAVETSMQRLKSALKWTLIVVAFLVAVGLLTMTGDKPPQDAGGPSNPPPTSAQQQ